MLEKNTTAKNTSFLELRVKNSHERYYGPDGEDERGNGKNRLKVPTTVKGSRRQE